MNLGKELGMSEREIFATVNSWQDMIRHLEKFKIEDTRKMERVRCRIALRASEQRMEKGREAYDRLVADNPE